MPPSFGIAYFRGTIFTLRHSPHHLMVHIFLYVLTIDPYIRLFVSSFCGTFSPYPVFQPRGISVGIPFLLEWLQPSFCRIYLFFKPHNLLVMTHAEYWRDGFRIHGSIIPILGCKVKIIQFYSPVFHAIKRL
jgi:hypothetical protein